MKITLITLLASLLANNINLNNENKFYCSFSDSKKILIKKSIKDFSNNEFTLYELEDGYAIYDSQGEFIEGSNGTQSSYYNISKYDNLYYMGPGNYFYFYNGKLYKTQDSKEVNYNLLKGVSLKKNINEEYVTEGTLNTNVSRNSGGSSDGSSNTFIDSDGFTKIDNSYYFENLSYFPDNYDGCCGVVATSILLGYLDTFYNDNFISNNYYYPDDNGFSRKLINMGAADSESSDYSFNNWIKMPGTNNSLKNYIMDNYMELAIDLDWIDGYPMDGFAIYKTINNYLNGNYPSLINKISASYSSVALARTNIKSAINEGRPALAVLLSYETDNGYNLDLSDLTGHVVVAYGYKVIDNNTCFLTHFGWSPNQLIDTEIIINSGYFYGSYDVKYNGEHIHSSNVKMDCNYSYAYICGCGHVSWPTC